MLHENVFTWNFYSDKFAFSAVDSRSPILKGFQLLDLEGDQFCRLRAALPSPIRNGRMGHMIGADRVRAANTRVWLVCSQSSLKRPLGRAGEHGWTAWGGHPSRQPPMSRGSMCRDDCRATTTQERRDDFIVLLRLVLLARRTDGPILVSWCARRGQLGLGLIGVWWTGRSRASAQQHMVP